jgi:hypothetical protein
MISLVALLESYETLFRKKYAAKLSARHFQAISAIKRCRTAQSGELHVQCTACDHTEWKPHSCGHRSCPQCQNYEASQWLARQQHKQLPVDYFMVTFTLPFQLRALTALNQQVIYQLMFLCVSSTLKDFGLNPDNLGAEIGMTAVLHTHTRQLDYHPHIHVIIPGGGIDRAKRQWIKTKNKFLFNEFALAKVFRARMLDGLNAEKLPIPYSMPKKWVVDCQCVGQGEPALKYLSRYLYRGVISEKNILSEGNGEVTFQYLDSETNKPLTRTLKGEDFLWLVLQHVLPKGFRRVRDYGFLHGNAKTLLKLVQLVLREVIQWLAPKPRPVFKCPHCQAPMVITGFRPPGFSNAS